MSNSVRPYRRQPTRLPCPWDSPGKNTGMGCHFLLQCMKIKSENEVTQSCPTPSNPMDCSLPGSSVHGIFQARVLEWVAIAFSALYVLLTHITLTTISDKYSYYFYLIVAYTTCRRRQWQPTSVLLPGKSHGWRSLEGCSPWGR